jgi:hypothetical protein
LTLAAPKELLERFIEIKLMPTFMHSSLRESAILDCLHSEALKENVGSFQDAQQFTVAKLKLWGLYSTAMHTSQMHVRLAQELFITITSMPAVDTEGLSSLLRKQLKIRERKAPMVVFLKEDTKTIAHVRVPVLDPKDTGGIQNLAVCLRWICSLSGCDQTQVRIVKDSDLGNRCPMPASFQNFLNSMVEGTQNSKGIAPLNLFTVKGEIRFNLIEALASIRVLGIHRHLIRKKTPLGRQEVVIVESSELREAFNTAFGLKSISSSWLLEIIKDTLAFSTSTRCDTFPGGLIHAACERVKASDTKSLLNHLGWVPIVAPFSFFKTCVYNKTVIAGKGLDIQPFAEDAKLNYIEHRTLVHTAISRIDVDSPVAFEEQLAVGPLSDKIREGTLKFSNSKDGRDLMNAVDLCYNIRNACRNPKGKATPEHFEKARGRLLHSSANLRFIDASGKEYAKFSELPEKLRLFCTKHFGFDNQKAKRARSPEQEMDTVMEEPVPKVPATSAVGEGEASASQSPATKSLSERRKEAAAQTAVFRSDPRVRSISARDVRRAGGPPRRPQATSRRGQREEERRRAEAQQGSSSSKATGKK